MCANYLPSRAERLQKQFGVATPAHAAAREAFPGYLAPIVRLAEDGSGERECVAACFGLVPAWADLKLSRHTYNARTETVGEKPSFRSAFHKRQFCIVPAEAFFEPNYESGHPVRWRIGSDAGQDLGIAGIWDWRPHGGPNDQPLVSFSMLTINADHHPLMRRFHKPGDEKRMVVILEPDQYADWLQADAEEARSFFTTYPAEKLQAAPAPRVALRKAAPRQNNLPLL
ncbi:SOS response-associated peptidase [Noviherbaspirillum sedimenti]|uniref:Abasic site processing protein n=1 Tax=Noviherbaspirillum sedimenti TaxID=2320865 RepID=A0A3A3G5Z0_9BURK|nr:SOS response-associated peptidase family protein [Noviherbaspirillum sedimenti]RJG03868.1 SOS response-associated peptidase [Noviherbaspirillum sedimenti]